MYPAVSKFSTQSPGHTYLCPPFLVPLRRSRSVNQLGSSSCRSHGRKLGFRTGYVSVGVLLAFSKAADLREKLDSTEGRVSYAWRSNPRWVPDRGVFSMYHKHVPCSYEPISLMCRLALPWTDDKYEGF